MSNLCVRDLPETGYFLRTINIASYGANSGPRIGVQMESVYAPQNAKSFFNLDAMFDHYLGFFSAEMQIDQRVFHTNYFEAGLATQAREPNNIDLLPCGIRSLCTLSASRNRRGLCQYIIAGSKVFFTLAHNMDQQGRTALQRLALSGHFVEHEPRLPQDRAYGYYNAVSNKTDRPFIYEETLAGTFLALAAPDRDGLLPVSTYGFKLAFV